MSDELKPCVGQVETDFERQVKQAAQKAVLKMIGEGSWVVPDYQNRVKIPQELLAQIWQMVDIEAIKKKMAERLQEELAERIMNHMAAEVATDVKQILSVKERREALRHYARAHLDNILAGKIGN